MLFTAAPCHSAVTMTSSECVSLVMVQQAWERETERERDPGTGGRRNLSVWTRPCGSCDWGAPESFAANHWPPLAVPLVFGKCIFVQEPSVRCGVVWCSGYIMRVVENGVGGGGLVRAVGYWGGLAGGGWGFDYWRWWLVQTLVVREPAARAEGPVGWLVGGASVAIRCAATQNGWVLFRVSRRHCTQLSVKPLFARRADGLAPGPRKHVKRTPVLPAAPQFHRCTVSSAFLPYIKKRR